MFLHGIKFSYFSDFDATEKIVRFVENSHFSLVKYLMFWDSGSKYNPVISP